MKFILVVLLLSIASISVAATGTITLTWDPNKEPDLAGYYVYQKTGNLPTAQFLQMKTILKGTQTAVFPALDMSQTYYFAVTAFNTNGNESTFSKIATVFPYPVAPLGLTFTITPQ